MLLLCFAQRSLLATGAPTAANPAPPSSPPPRWPCPRQARTDAGVPEGAVRLTDAALAALVDDYAR